MTSTANPATITLTFLIDAQPGAAQGSGDGGATWSVTEAARDLHYSQPSVSHHLARLESATGVHASWPNHE
jgi:DNA-binding MarR family transcriptional regulator